MALIKRLKRITMAKIEAYLEAVEDPETIMPQLIAEMADKVKQAAGAEAKALTAVKAAQRKLDEAAGRAERMQQGAALAVAADDTDTARRAIAAQIDAEADSERIHQALRTAEDAHADAHATRVRLEGDLERLQKKTELIGRARAAQEAKTCYSAAARCRDTEPILDAVVKMEEAVERDEVEAEALGELNRLLGNDLDRYRVEDLQRDQEVQRRLDQLKREGGTG